MGFICEHGVRQFVAALTSNAPAANALPMDATAKTDTAKSDREALVLLTTYLALQGAISDRLALLVEHRDNPAVDVEAWDRLIEEVTDKRRLIAGRIANLQSRLGINHLQQVH